MLVSFASMASFIVRERNTAGTDYKLKVILWKRPRWRRFVLYRSKEVREYLESKYRVRNLTFAVARGGAIASWQTIPLLGHIYRAAAASLCFVHPGVIFIAKCRKEFGNKFSIYAIEFREYRTRFRNVKFKQNCRWLMHNLKLWRKHALRGHGQHAGKINLSTPNQR